MTAGIPDIDDLILTETDPHERERLARVHDALARSEPFPELPASLGRPPLVEGVPVLPLPRRARALRPAWRPGALRPAWRAGALRPAWSARALAPLRHGRLQRRTAAAAAAATVALAGAGVAHLATAPSAGVAGETWRVVAMHATSAAPQAKATLRVGSRDRAGNWAVTLRVRDLPRLPANGYYEMLLTRNGRLVGSCGTFRADGGATVVHLNVPYRITDSSGWLIRRATGDDHLGPLLLTT